MSVTDHAVRGDAGRRRAQLLDAARDEFAVRGFQATSIRDIASRVGILGGSVYYYIDSKEELLFELFQRVYEPALELIDGLDTDDAAALGELERLVARHVELVASDRMGTALVFNEAGALGEAHRAEAAAIERRFAHTVKGLIERGRRHGSVRADVDASLATLAILGAANWMHRWYQPDGEVPLERVGSEMGAILVHGLTPPGAEAQDVPAEETEAIFARAGERSTTDFGGGRRAEVVEIAAQLFADQGYESTTLQEIAERVGMRKASLYHYVPSKRQLLFWVIRSVREPALSALDDVLARPWPPLQKLRVMATFHALQRAEDMIAMRLQLQERRALADEDRENIEADDRAHRHALRDLVLEAQRDGSIRPDVHAGFACHAILGAANWVPHWYRPDGPRSAMEVGRSVGAAIIDGVAADQLA